MTTASALQGTRMGRKVTSVGEAIAEARRYAELKGSEAGSESLEPVNQIPLSNTPAEDIFSYSTLTDPSIGLWELTGLEVPEGTWSKIQLRTYNEEIRDRPRADSEDWIQYSNGKLTFDSSKLPTNNGYPFDRKEHIATAKSLYWFLRAEYESLEPGRTNEPALKRTIHVMSESCPLILSDRAIQLNTFNNIGDQIKLLVTTTRGWPEYHPLMARYESELPECELTQYHTNTRLTDAITNLFGDPNVSRIGNVLGWVFGRAALFSIESLSKDKGYQFCLDANRGEVRLNYKPEFCRAVHIIADPNDFTPRVRK